MNNYFCGWYYRCQSEEQTIAFIPAIHISNGMRTSSIQIISSDGSWNVTSSSERVAVRADKPLATLDNCVFRESGIEINVHTDDLSAEGALRFSALSPIRYDIMGPFRFVPFMECRHSVFSMRHRVNGALRINGTDYIFRDGTGYIEGDRGRSFPKHYVWTQCFFDGGSLMLSVAEMPMGPINFTGVISVIHLNGEEYRLATYLGAKTVKTADGEVIIRQGELELTAALLSRNAFTLNAPIGGAMTRLIRENAACHAKYSFIKKGKTILSVETSKAAFEYEYP